MSSTGFKPLAYLFKRLCLALCYFNCKMIMAFSVTMYCVLEASLDAREVWGLWLMLKAFAPATWRKEIRARCQQISKSTWLTGQTLLCVCVFPAVIHTQRIQVRPDGFSSGDFASKSWQYVYNSQKFTSKTTTWLTKAYTLTQSGAQLCTVRDLISLNSLKLIAMS